MSFNAETISLVLSILLGVFVLWGIVWGLIRGFKNSLWRGLYILVVMVVAFFLASIVSKATLNFSWGNYFTLEVDGIKYVQLEDYLSAYIKSSVETTVETANVVSSLLTVITIALNSFIFVLIFWLLKWIFSPVYSILRRWFFDRKRYEKKEIKKGNKVKTKTVKVKTKRYRLAGAAVGAVLGLVMCTFTLLPVVGYLNMAQSVEEQSRKQNETVTGVVSDTIGEENYNTVIDGYNNSIYKGVMKYTGMEFLSEVLFDNLSSTKVNDVKISLNQEVSTGLEVYNAVTKMNMPDLNTCTEAELGEFLTQCRTLTNTVFKSGIVNSSLTELMPIVVDYLEQTDMIQDLSGAKRVFAINALNNLAQTYSDEIKTEVLGLIGLMQSLNDYGLAVPILQDDTGNIVDFLQLTTNRAVVTDITEKLFALKTVDKVAPDIANVVVEYICSALNIENQTISDITSTSLKESLQNILYSMVDILPDLDSKSDYIVTKNAVRGIGKVIDSIQNASFVNTTMFDSIIDTVQDKLSEMTSGVPDWAVSITNEAIENLSNITDFTTEFEKIYTIVDYVDKACRDSQNKRSTKLEDIKFGYIGEALDILQNIVITNRTNPPAGEVDNLVPAIVVEAIKNYTKDLSLSGTPLDSLSSVTQLKANITNLNDTVDWSQDMPKIKSLIISAKNLANDSTNLTDKLKDSTQKQEFVDLGTALDEASTTMIFVGNVDRKFVVDILDIVDDSYSTDTDMLNAITEIKSNISTETSITWSNEFENIVELVNMEFDNVLTDSTPAGEHSKAYILGDTIDRVIANSDIITSKIIDTFICSVVDTNFSGTTYDKMANIVKKTFSDVDNDDTTPYQNGIDCYAVEFEALNTLYQARSIVDDGTFNLEDDAEELGQKIDQALATTITVGGTSYSTRLVTSELIDTFIKDVLDTKFDDSDTDFADALSMIKAKFSDVDDDDTTPYTNSIQNYTVEFKALGRLQQIVDYVNATGFEFKTNGQALGELIDLAVATTYSTYQTRVVTEELVDTYIRKVLDNNISTTDSDLNVTKSTILAKFNRSNPTGVYQNGVEWYEVEFKALAGLITNIVDATIDVDSNAGRTGLGTNLDNLTNTSIVKSDTTYYTQVVTPSVLNPYIKRKLNDITIDSDYSTLKNTILSDINGYLDNINGTTYTYTGCFTDINTLTTEMDQIDTTDTTWGNTTILANIQTKINTVQNTTVFSAKLGRQMMIIVLDKMYAYYEGQITDTTLFATKSKTLRAYKEYLGDNLSDTSNEPYTSNTDATESVLLDGETVTVYKNKPLEHIYTQITSA